MTPKAKTSIGDKGPDAWRPFISSTVEALQSTVREVVGRGWGYRIAVAESACCDVCSSGPYNPKKVGAAPAGALMDHRGRVSCSKKHNTYHIAVIGLKRPGSGRWASLQELLDLDVARYPHKPRWLSRVLRPAHPKAKYGSLHAQYEAIKTYPMDPVNVDLRYPEDAHFSMTLPVKFTTDEDIEAADARGPMGSVSLLGSTSALAHAREEDPESEPFVPATETSSSASAPLNSHLTDSSSTPLTSLTPANVLASAQSAPKDAGTKLQALHLPSGPTSNKENVSPIEVGGAPIASDPRYAGLLQQDIFSNFLHFEEDSPNFDAPKSLGQEDETTSLSYPEPDDHGTRTEPMVLLHCHSDGLPSRVPWSGLSPQFEEPRNHSIAPGQNLHGPPQTIHTMVASTRLPVGGNVRADRRPGADEQRNSSGDDVSEVDSNDGLEDWHVPIYVDYMESAEIQFQRESSSSPGDKQLPAFDRSTFGPSSARYLDYQHVAASSGGWCTCDPVLLVAVGILPPDPFFWAHLTDGMSFEDILPLEGGGLSVDDNGAWVWATLDSDVVKSCGATTSSLQTSLRSEK